MENSANNSPRRLDDDEAVDLILSPSEDKAVESLITEEVDVIAKPATTEKAEDASADDDGAESPASDEAEPVDAEDGSEEEAEAETTDKETEELDSEEEEEQEVLYTLPTGEEVTLEELKRGNLRQADYTQKTQALAEDRQAFDSDVQGLGQERNVAAEALMMAMNIVEPQLVQGAQTDWQALSANDPYEYAEKWAEYQQAQVRWGNLQQAGEQATQAQKQQSAVQAQAYGQEQSKALQLAIPDLADPTKAKALQSSLREYAMSSGLSEQEAGGIKDHRVVVMLNKARLYDEMMNAGTSVAKKKISKAPKKVLKPGQPVSKAEKQASSKKAKLANVRSRGTDDAAVEWLLSGGT